jgi:hypothetical protein
LADTRSVFKDIWVDGISQTVMKWGSSYMVSDDFRSMLWQQQFLIRLTGCLTFCSLYLGLLINCLVMIDLFLALKNPFYPRKKRVTVYSLVIVVTFILIVVQYYKGDLKFG